MKLLAPPDVGLVVAPGSRASCTRMGEMSESEVTVTSLYICSISGVIKPWLIVRLDLARNERRWRETTRETEMSSCVIEALGDRSASGCGRLVFLSVESCKPSVLVLREREKEGTYCHKTTPGTLCPGLWHERSRLSTSHYVRWTLYLSCWRTASSSWLGESGETWVGKP